MTDRNQNNSRRVGRQGKRTAAKKVFSVALVGNGDLSYDNESRNNKFTCNLEAIIGQSCAEWETKRRVYYDHKCLPGGLEVHKGRRNSGMGEDNFSLKHFEFVELCVAFSYLNTGKPCEYVKALEKWQRSGINNWDSTE